MEEPVQATVGQSLGASADPITITWDKHTWSVDPPTPFMISKIENEVARRILDVPERVRGVVSPEVYQREQTAARASLAANAHQFGGEVYRAVVTGVDGVALTLWAAIREPVPLAEVQRFVVADRLQAMRLYAMLVPGFLSVAATRSGADRQQLDAILQQAEPRIAQMLADAATRSTP